MSENTAWKKGGTPTFLGECKSSISNTSGAYAFYGRGNPNDIDDHPVRGPIIGRLIFSHDKENPWGEFYIACYKKEADTIEAFIETDDPKKKQTLQDFIQEVYKAHEWRQSSEPAFKKLEDIHQHDILNQSKLGMLRSKIAHSVDNLLGTHFEEKKMVKPLKKIEKAVSDKLFGKVKE